MVPNFRSKIGKISLFTFILRIAFHNGLEYRNGKLVELRSSDSGVTRDVSVHSLVDQQFSYVCLAAPLR